MSQRFNPTIMYAADHEGSVYGDKLTHAWPTGRVLGYTPHEMAVVWVQHREDFRWTAHAWCEDAGDPSINAKYVMLDAHDSLFEALDAAWRLTIAVRALASVHAFIEICIDVFNMVEDRPKPGSAQVFSLPVEVRAFVQSVGK